MKRLLLLILLAIIFPTNELFSQWSHITDYPAGQGRFLPFSFVINDKLYMGMGFEHPQAIQSDFYEYDYVNNSWTQKSNPPFTARMGAFSFVIGNYGYVGSGSTNGGAIVLQDLWRYDQSNDSWQQMTNFLGQGRMVPAVFVINNKAYIVGGVSSSGNTKDCWEYNPQQNIWTQKSNPPANFTTRYQVGFTNGVYGYCGLGTANDFWRYSPVSDNWMQMPSLPQPTRMWTVGGFGIEPGKAFVGLGGDYGNPYYKDFYSFDFANENWTALTQAHNFPIGITNALAFNLGGNLYIGTGGKEGTPAGYVKAIYRYAPCDCDDLSYSMVKYATSNPDHKCCYDVTIHSNCNNYNISQFTFFCDPSVMAMVSNVSSPNDWMPVYDGAVKSFTFKHLNWFIPQGDHTFRVCLGSDMQDNSATMYIAYQDSNNVWQCPLDTLEINCEECPKILNHSIECGKKDANGVQWYILNLEIENPTNQNMLLEWDHSDFDANSPFGLSLPPGISNHIKTFPNTNNVTNGCIETYLQDQQNNRTCKEKFCFDLPKCGSCCENFYKEIQHVWYHGKIINSFFYNTCSFSRYLWVNLKAGPLPIKRVGMHVVRATRFFKYKYNDSVYYKSMPLATQIIGVSTRHSLDPNPPTPNTWIYQMGGGRYADFGYAAGPTWLPLDNVSGPNSSRNEVIYGGFNSTEAIDMFNVLIGSAPTANYRITFKKTCFSKDYGIPLGDTIRLMVRYYFTDESCCTCDTLEEITIPIRVPDFDSNYLPPASITMTDLTHGKLALRLNPDNTDDMLINSVAFEPLENVQIKSMKDSKTGDAAVIKDNIATLIFKPDNWLLDTLTFDVEFINPENNYMFKNNVTVNLGFVLDSLPSYWSEEFSVLAKIENNDSPDQLKEIPLPEGRVMKTFALQLSNMNGYKEPITFIKLNPILKDCKIEAVGRPLQGESGVLVSMLEYKAESFAFAHEIVDTSMDQDGWDRYSPYWSLKPNSSFEPIIITISYPSGTTEPMGFEFTTFNNERVVLSNGEISMPLSIIENGGENQGNNEMKISCFPNPANTEVTFYLEANKAFDNLSIELYNEKGDKVAIIVENQFINVGINLIQYKIIGFPSGSYYYTVKSGEFTKTKLLNILK
jgi:N-acetylneuraminic acid mutarotase